MGFFEFLKGNLLHVLPNLGLAAAAIVIIFERVHALYKRYVVENEDQLLQQVRSTIIKDGPDAARQVVAAVKHTPIGTVLDEALVRASLPEEMIRDGIQIQIGRLSKLIQKKTGFLSMIANVATLIGLFGTILGLISSFEAVAHADPQQKATLLSNGIAVAMNATMLGLGIAIPCMIAYSILMNRSNKLVSDLEDAGLLVIDALRSRFVGSVDGPGKKDVA